MALNDGIIATVTRFYKGDDNDPAYNTLPQIVRELCDFEDDPSTPVLTWRFFFLSAIFTALGA